MNKLEVKILCNKDPKDVTMVEYQNLKSSMLDQLGEYMERMQAKAQWSVRVPALCRKEKKLIG